MIEHSFVRLVSMSTSMSMWEDWSIEDIDNFRNEFIEKLHGCKKRLVGFYEQKLESEVRQYFRFCIITGMYMYVYMYMYMYL